MIKDKMRFSNKLCTEYYALIEMEEASGGGDGDEINEIDT
jgi:hypothetical protein